MPIKSSEALYTGVATAEGGREGRVSTDDGKLDVVVSQPKELGGTGAGTNPEQLFAACYSACFHASLGIIAQMQKIDITGSSVTARVGIGRNDAGFGIVAELTAHLPTVDEATAKTLVEKADQICPYSKVTRGDIEVTVKTA
ncbi:organic hydroperoxide resistance protein [Streptomyces sp. NPDC003717]|uniref:organic hydroperoxide resistance protein n=1 Tax=Streptomyces sp. NPDC003717 TaxID=3154276 RepID=UPI00339EACE3